MATTIPAWRSGAFAPVDEEITATDIEVEGLLPPELDGTLVRNGPNPFTPYQPTDHWFIGDGMLHGLRVLGGRAQWYRNRWVRTGLYEFHRGNGPAPDFLGQDSPANVHAMAHRGQLYAWCEGGAPYAIDDDLGTQGLWDFGGKLVGPAPSHPKVDAVTGEMIMHAYDWKPPFLRYHVVDADGTLSHSTEIDVPAPVMMHDCAITATRTVLMDLPICFDLGLVQHTGMPFRWKPDNGARFGVLPRRGSNDDVTWLTLDEPCYIFHTFNAFDDGERIVLDCARYDEQFVWDDAAQAFDQWVLGRLPTTWRYILDPASGTVKGEPRSDVPAEFPRVDDALLGRAARYGYGARPVTGDTGAENSVRGIVKVDLDSGESTVRDFPRGHITSEAVFVPAPGGSNEDDGWLLTVVYDPDRDASDVLVLDATDINAAPAATVHLPARVPVGFHGSWVATAPV